MGYTQRTLKIPESLLWFPPLVVMLFASPYPTFDKTAFQVKIALKWSYFPHKFIYFLRSKCNNKFGLKPMLLSNGEQFNKGLVTIRGREQFNKGPH